MIKCQVNCPSVKSSKMYQVSSELFEHGGTWAGTTAVDPAVEGRLINNWIFKSEGRATALYTLN